MPEPERSRRDHEDRPGRRNSHLCRRRESASMPPSIERSTTTSATAALTMTTDASTGAATTNDNATTPTPNDNDALPLAALPQRRCDGYG